MQINQYGVDFRRLPRHRRVDGGDARNLICAQVVLPSDYEKVVARHLKRTSRDSRDERRLSRSTFSRDQALRDLGATRPPSQEEEEAPNARRRPTTSGRRSRGAPRGWGYRRNLPC